MFKVTKFLCISYLVVWLVACETTPSGLYYWGAYEDLLYDMYHQPSEAPAEKQIEKLTQNIAYAENRGWIVGPGIHAHLGMLYASIGNMSAAKQELTKEKILFPESAVFIDGMLERAEKNFVKGQTAR